MEFHKLQVFGNNNQITTSKIFDPLFTINEFVDKVFGFSFGMSFGNLGEHRTSRTGGVLKRRKGELFINTFQGKMCEFGIYKYLKGINILSEEPTLDLWKLGVWDDVDLKINSLKLSIKSASYFSNLLLLEKQDWDINGQYIPNIGIKSSNYDLFVLTRLKPNSKSLMTINRILYNDQIDEKYLYKLIHSQIWEFDIPGFINQKDLVSIINQKHVLPQNSTLNSNTKIDADNYYCQSGDLRTLKELEEILKFNYEN
jgi:hypothetical protein